MRYVLFDGDSHYFPVGRGLIIVSRMCHRKTWPPTFFSCWCIHKQGLAKKAGKAVSLCESSSGVRGALVADAERSGTLRAEDAVSGWNDARDLRSTGFYCKIGGADSEAESEPGDCLVSDNTFSESTRCFLSRTERLPAITAIELPSNSINISWTRNLPKNKLASSHDSA